MTASKGNISKRQAISKFFRQYGDISITDFQLFFATNLFKKTTHGQTFITSLSNLGKYSIIDWGNCSHVVTKSVEYFNDFPTKCCTIKISIPVRPTSMHHCELTFNNLPSKIAIIFSDLDPQFNNPETISSIRMCSCHNDSVASGTERLAF